VLDGESIRVIAVDTGHSESAASRHLRNHLRPERMQGMRASLAVHVSHFADRLLILTNEATEVREYAKRVSDPRLVLQAIASERDTLSLLITRLGIDDSESVEALSEGRALARSVMVLLSGRPELASEVAGWLAAEGAGELADAITAHASSPATIEVLYPPKEITR